MCEADALVAGAAAAVIKKHLPEVYAAMWAPVLAAPVVAPICIYPTPAQQGGRGRREWDVQDRLPSEADAAAFPFGHYASRKSGVAKGEGEEAQRACVAFGVSNSHSAQQLHPTPLLAWPTLGFESRAALSRPRGLASRVRVADCVRVTHHRGLTRLVTPDAVVRYVPSWN